MTETDTTPATAGVAAPPEYLLRLADDRLVLGHRLSEWCGHAPILEEDIALANIALDLVGQATHFLDLAAAREGRGRTADDLAYFRDAREYLNVQLVELPKGDFAFTIVRQFLFDVYDVLALEALEGSADAELAAIAAKAHREARYHLRHSAQWMLRLGDGTGESHRRAQNALDELWRFTGELFIHDELDARLREAGVAPDLESLRERWAEEVARVVSAATLRLPEDRSLARGGRQGLHTEHLGLMLAEMQSVARAHPGAQW
ncbi:MAG TPA: 1,2-phenylacetyl-CoA epoxidase subunit PaaC [Gemmatimonadales bacterium]